MYSRTTRTGRSMAWQYSGSGKVRYRPLISREQRRRGCIVGQRLGAESFRTLCDEGSQTIMTAVVLTCCSSTTQRLITTTSTAPPGQRPDSAPLPCLRHAFLHDGHSLASRSSERFWGWPTPRWYVSGVTVHGKWCWSGRVLHGSRRATDLALADDDDELLPASPVSTAPRHQDRFTE